MDIFNNHVSKCSPSPKASHLLPLLPKGVCFSGHEKRKGSREKCQIFSDFARENKTLPVKSSDNRQERKEGRTKKRVLAVGFQALCASFISELRMNLARTVRKNSPDSVSVKYITCRQGPSWECFPFFESFHPHDADRDGASKFRPSCDGLLPRNPSSCQCCCWQLF